MMLQLNPTIDVLTPKGKAEAIMIIDYGVNVNSVWLCRMQGGKVLHFYSDDIRVYDNPMNGNGWDVVPDFEKTQEDEDPPSGEDDFILDFGSDKICTKCGLAKPIYHVLTTFGEKTEYFCEDCYVKPNSSTIRKPL